MLLLLMLGLALQMPIFLGKFYLNLGFVSSLHSKVLVQDSSDIVCLQQAEYLLSQSAQYPQTSQAAKWGLGLMLLAKEDKTGAVAVWQEAQVPVENLLIFGDQAAERRNWDKALTWYEVAAGLDFAKGADAFAKLLYQQKDYETAITIWQRALDDFPEHAQRLNWWQGLTSSFSANKQWDKAIALSDTALSEFPEDPVLLTTLGNAIYYSGQDINVAIGMLQHAIASDNEFAEAYAAMGHIMTAEKRYDEAYSWYSQAIERNPDVNWWYLARANTVRNKGSVPQAIALYQDFIDHYPGYAAAYFEIAWAYHLNEESELAMIAIEKAIELSPPDANYYFRAGSIYEEAGKTDNALAMYQEVLKIAPSHEAAKIRFQRLEETMQQH